MPRYLVVARRDRGGPVQPAADLLAAEPGVELVGDLQPHQVLIEASAETAEALRRRLVDTHYVELETKRGLL